MSKVLLTFTMSRRLLSPHAAPYGTEGETTGEKSLLLAFINSKWSEKYSFTFRPAVCLDGALLKSNGKFIFQFI